MTDKSAISKVRTNMSQVGKPRTPIAPLIASKLSLRMGTRPIPERDKHCT